MASTILSQFAASSNKKLLASMYEWIRILCNNNVVIMRPLATLMPFHFTKHVTKWENSEKFRPLCIPRYLVIRRRFQPITQNIRQHNTRQCNAGWRNRIWDNIPWCFYVKQSCTKQVFIKSRSTGIQGLDIARVTRLSQRSMQFGMFWV
jgi:hypothetical protein